MIQGFWCYYAISMHLELVGYYNSRPVWEIPVHRSQKRKGLGESGVQAVQPAFAAQHRIKFLFCFLCRVRGFALWLRIPGQKMPVGFNLSWAIEVCNKSRYLGKPRFENCWNSPEPWKWLLVNCIQFPNRLNDFLLQIAQFGFKSYLLVEDLLFIKFFQKI